MERAPAVATRQLPGLDGSMLVRLAAAAGVVYFALIMAFASLTTGAPSATDPGQTVIDFMTDSSERLQLAAVAYALAMPAALLMLAGLFRTLRAAEGLRPGLAEAVLGGGVLAAASTTTGALILGTTVNRVSDLDPSSARVWWTMFMLSIGATLVGLALVTGGTAIVSLRTHVFARWFTVASVVLALVSVLGACSIGYAVDWLQVVAGIAVLLDTVWILLVSLFLWRDHARAPI